MWQDGDKASSINDFFAYEQDEFCIKTDDKLKLSVNSKFPLIKDGYDIESYSDLIFRSGCGGSDRMIDTTEAGGGSYPSPEEEKMKCYQFEFNATISGYGIVYAEDEYSASLKAEQGDYDDILDTWGMKIEEITKIEEE